MLKIENISIHVFCWRRELSLRRLCNSLLRAEYFGHSVPIHFHIDGESLDLVDLYVEQFHWPFGPKHIDKRERSILSGWNPISNDEFGILLEDDIEVSEGFFEWCLFCVKARKMKIDGLVGCSMYTPKVNEIGPAPNEWSPPHWDPHNVIGNSPLFYFQLPCSWGAIYFGDYWREFLEYYEKRESLQHLPIVAGSRSNEWSNSWKRALIELMLIKGYFMLYPNFPNHASFSTNYFEKGMHSVKAGQEIHIENKIKTKGDYRFNVPLLRFEEYRPLPDISKQIPFVNLWHEKVNGRINLYKNLTV